MKTGQISYNQMQRCIRKPMKSGSGLLPGFVRYRGCAVLGEEQEGSCVSAIRSGGLDREGAMELLFARCENELLCQGAACRWVSASLIWPTARTDEPTEITARLEALCQEAGAVPAQIFITCSDAAVQPVLTLSAFGTMKYRVPAPKAGMAIAAVGHAGMAGAALLAAQAKDGLRARYSQGFLEQAEAFFKERSLRGIAAVPAAFDSYLFPVGEGGVLAALWYLADGAGIGFDLDLKRIPIRQETVEICEYYRANPYQLAGDGMALALTASPERFVSGMEAVGIPAAVIGVATGDKARILRNEDEVRYLDKPAQDELYRLDAAAETESAVCGKDWSNTHIKRMGGSDERKNFGNY